MKTVFITAHEDNIVKVLKQEIEKHTGLEVVGAGPLDANSKQNCSFEQPDFIVTGNIGNSEAKELLELCISSHIIMVSDDMNRANAVINHIQKDGNYRLTAIDLNNVTPTQLCEQLLNFETNNEEDDSLSNMLEGFTVNEADLLNSEIANEKIEDNNTTEEFEDEAKEASQIEEKISAKETTVQETVRQNSFNLNINNIRSKTITVYSKKGGTGKTNIAKELCNVYSSVKPPKKLQNGNEYLRACVVDFDFERGNLRTYLGMDNPSPNIYYWINDILDRIENKADIDKIAYNQFQVMGYVKKVDGNGNYYALVTSQGGLPPRTMSRLAALDSKGDLLPKILNIIITSLKRAFDIVVIDTDTDYNEITKTAFEAADNIIYVLNPTVSDIENLKVFTDEVSQNDMVDLNKVGLVLNKLSKHITFKNEILDVLSLVKYRDINYSTNEEIDKNYPLIADIPYDENIINLNNAYLFTTNNAVQETKKGILKLCEYTLPIFKVTYTTAGLAELQKAKAKKAKMELQKTKKSKKNAKGSKAEEKVKQLKGEEVNNETTTPNEDANIKKYNNPMEYLESDLSKESLETFVATLKTFDEVKKARTGFPMLKAKPKTLSKKTWKLYQKQLEKEIKKSAKLKKTGK